jgi:hypothetical protein
VRRAVSLRGHVAGIMAAAICALGAPTSHAQEDDEVAARARAGPPLTLSGSSRLRYETLAGQPRAGLPETDQLLSLRTSIFAEIGIGPVRIGGELYDSRAWLGKPGSAVSANDVNAVELVQAYADFDFGFGTVRAGRLKFDLGSRRLVAAHDYRNTVNGYTGAHAALRVTPQSDLTLFYVLPQTRLPDDQPSVLDNAVEPDRESFDLQLWGAHFAQRQIFGSAAIAELGYVGLAERDSDDLPTRDRHLHSVDVRILRNPAPGKGDFELEAVYQFGGISSDTGQSAARLGVSAWFAHADAGYSFATPIPVRLSLEYDYASGDGPDGSYGRFDTLYGTRRSDFGPGGIYADIGRANISTPAIRIEATPSERLDLFAGYRLMWLASRMDGFSTTGVRDPEGGSGDFAGEQIEARVRWWAVPDHLRAEVNLALLLKGGFLRKAPNSPGKGDTSYAAVSLTTLF